jgi:hypothetical protein
MLKLRTALVWVITQQVVVITYPTFRDNVGSIFRVKNPKKDGTNRLSRNVGKKLPLLAV